MKNKSVFKWQIYLGFILIVTGGLFLVDQFLDLEIMSFFWPLLVVLFGLTFFVGMLLSGKRAAGLAIPGAVITTAGVLLSIQNTFQLWVTWAYAWALLISATGLGLLMMNFYLKRLSLQRAAGIIIGIGFGHAYEYYQATKIRGEYIAVGGSFSDSASVSEMDVSRRG